MNLRKHQFVKYVTYLSFTRYSCYMYLVYILDAQCTVVYIHGGPPRIRPPITRVYLLLCVAG